MMKKLLGSVIVLSLTCGLAMGAVQITWNSTGQEIKDDTGANAPVSYWAQMIWTPDGSTAPVSIDTPLVPAAGFELVAEGNLYVSGAIITPVAPQGPDTLAGGFVYTIVFNDASAPTLFGTGPATGNPNNAADGSLTVTTADPLTLNNHNPGAIAVDQVIPEPATLALLGIGALTALWRRRR